MKKISIEYLKNEDYVDYIDGDLFIIEDVEKLPTIKMGAVEVEAIIVLHIWCRSSDYERHQASAETQPTIAGYATYCLFQLYEAD